MAENFDLIAEIREDQGKGASRRLRREGKVPAIIYGAGRPARSLVFDHKDVIKQLENESFYSSVLNIRVGDKSQAAILKDLQRHPARNLIMHMDLQRIVEDEDIRMNVPLHFLNEDDAVGVRDGGGKVSHLRTEVEVVCLPKFLPEYLEIDIADLELDQMLYLSNIKLPEGVEMPELALGPEHDHAIVSIHVIKVAVVEEDVEEIAEGEEGAVDDDAPATDAGGEDTDSEKSGDE
ncbi:MAG: 50S ribosomal protein L25/general stress protein Ctc [Proteobacteria bacterium]|nr:50S ribosomal protein L25/general stress protein Ctc [Pseudomonadota bacterium]